jgi:hypothetical protein
MLDMQLGNRDITIGRPCLRGTYTVAQASHGSPQRKVGDNERKLGQRPESLQTWPDRPLEDRLGRC